MFRLPLAIVCLSLSFLANCAALTLDEISLMLRSGVSSGEILGDLARGNFSETLDATWEKEFIRLHASPGLIEALRSGKQASSKASEIIKSIKRGEYAPSEEEKLRRRQFVNQLNDGGFAVNPLISEEKQAQQVMTSKQELAQQAAEQQQQAAERAQRAQRNSGIVVVPTQPESLGKLPSEIEAEEKAEQAAIIAKQRESQVLITRKRPVEKDDWQQQTQSVTPDAYGLGVNSDEFGRSHTYRMQDGEKLSPIFQGGVKRNAYGLGVHADEFGRAVYDGRP